MLGWRLIKNSEYERVKEENKTLRGCVELLKLKIEHSKIKRDAQGRFIRGIV